MLHWFDESFKVLTLLLLLLDLQRKIWSPTRKWAISKTYCRFLVDDVIWSLYLTGEWDYHFLFVQCCDSVILSISFFHVYPGSVFWASFWDLDSGGLGVIQLGFCFVPVRSLSLSHIILQVQMPLITFFGLEIVYSISVLFCLEVILYLMMYYIILLFFTNLLVCLGIICHPLVVVPTSRSVTGFHAALRLE